MNIKNLKTPDSAHEIFIQPELYKLCVEINNFVDRQDLIYSNKTIPLFFPSENGKYLNCLEYQKYLKNTSNHVLLRSISSHTLRSSHSSILRAQGVSNDAIACRLGYEDRIITKNINLPLSKKQKEQYNLQIANTNII